MRLLIFLSISLAAHINAYAQMAAPTGLTATWINSGGVRRISLSWQNNSPGLNTGWEVHRRIAAPDHSNWANQAGASSLTGAQTSFVDTSIASANILNYYNYRVRAKNGSAVSGWAEVVTAGISAQWPANNYDSDADGITDAAEVAAGLNPYNWTDGSGDLDGDLVPNAWEHDRGTSISGNNAINPDIVVDASYTGVDTSSITSTINGAIAQLTGVATNPPFRVILVKPGVYKENVNITKHIQIALIADRSGPNPKRECEIQGVTNAPVLSTESALVVDGFVVTRAPGTTGPAFAVSQQNAPGKRVYMARMTNCIVRNMNTGSEPVVKQTRGRVVLSHCTFYMNSLNDNALAHSYSTGPLSGSYLESTACLRVWNCVFWNPINTKIPEFHSVGDWAMTSSISYGVPLAGTVQVDPGLTPKGYLLKIDANASAGGTLGAQVLRDMYGQLRYDPPGRGAVEWVDGDTDGVPDIADSMPNSNVNADWDLDFDKLSELHEYQSGTSIESADSQSLTLEQALSIFESSKDLLKGVITKEDGDARYMPLNPNPLRKIRVAPGGNIDMGIFQ